MKVCVGCGRVCVSVGVCVMDHMVCYVCHSHIICFVHSEAPVVAPLLVRYFIGRFVKPVNKPQAPLIAMVKKASYVEIVGEGETCEGHKETDFGGTSEARHRSGHKEGNKDGSGHQEGNKDGAGHEKGNKDEAGHEEGDGKEVKTFADYFTVCGIF